MSSTSVETPTPSSIKPYKSFAFLETIIKSFSLTEKVLFAVSIGILCMSLLSILWRVNENFLVSVPSRGGTLVEGVIGYPRFINPILSYTEAGEDLGALIYSGLLKATPEGTLINDLAKEYTISPDHLTYTFTLKDDLYFHDGAPITTDDVEFTIKKAVDPSLKSGERVKWEGVTVLKIDEKTISFTLKNPYTPFLNNTTLGILPKHIWENADLEQFTFSQFNSEPIGSGPYKIKSIKRNSEGIPLYYKLEAFKEYARGIPKIKNIIVRFYPTEDAVLEAYKKGEVEAVDAIGGNEVSALENSGNIKKASLPRVFGIFFNQNQSKILSNQEVRRALEMAVDKKEIIDTVLHGFGEEISSPLPPGLIDVDDEKKNKVNPISYELRVEKAKNILIKNGWKQNEKGIFEKKTKTETFPLKFTLSTSDVPELVKTAELVKKQWAKIGADVEVKIFELGDFNQFVLRPRKYDAVLFGEIIRRDLDLYSFWHASERNDPGLNIALYANSKVNKALESAQTLIDKEGRVEQLHIIEEEIEKDIPAVFLYSPDFIYILPKKVKNVKIEQVMNPEERFANVSEWYINEDRVWRVFVQ